MHIRPIAVMILAGGLLAACYDEPGVTLHEPAVYKGKPDPLLNQDPQKRAEVLEERFQMVQTDR